MSTKPVFKKSALKEIEQDFLISEERETEKLNYEMTLALHQDSDDVIDPEEERFTSDASHVTDGVKLYLRDIGRIPLLNKETEKIIADTISTNQLIAIETIGQFPFFHN